MILVSDRAVLPCSVIKSRIIKGLKNLGISTKINGDVVVFKKDKKTLEKSISLLVLGDDTEDEDLRYEEYVDFVINFVNLILDEIEEN